MPSSVVAVRMPIPPTFPSLAVLVFLLIMDIEVIVGIPSYLQGVRNDEGRKISEVIPQDQRARSITGLKLDLLKTLISTQAGVYPIQNPEVYRSGFGIL